MVDLILKQIWNSTTAGWINMADLADRIDDLICSFESGGDTTMDTVAMLMFGWLLFALFVLAIGKYIYGKYFSSVKSLAAGDKATAAAAAPLVVPAVAAAATTATPSVSGDEGVVVAGKVTPARAAAPRATGVHVVPPTPPLRKRISKKGSGPATSVTRSPSVVPPPYATGPDSESVNWVNEVFYWLYSDLVIVNEILTVWIQSLNEFTKKSVAEHGVGVEFLRVLPESHPPSLSNVFSECAANDDVTITCDCEAMPLLQLKAFRQKGERVEVSHYRVNVNRFRARLSVHCATDKLLADVKCDGWPEIKVTLAPVGAIKNNLDEQELQDVITDIVVVALRNTLVHMNLGQYATCPRLERPILPPAGHILPLHYDSMLQGSHSSIPSSKTATDKRLLVKVIKANGLGAKKGCTEPYCVVEMDDPSQKNQTSVKKETNCPVWDEHFLFDLSPYTAEVLFEIYDRANRSTNKFLGLGIVSVEELLANPNQRQIISLQSRPYETDDVSGTLTVEFSFMDGKHMHHSEGTGKPYKLKETLRTMSPSGGVITTTKTTFAHADQITNGGDVVTDSALKELEMRNRGGNPQANKSTLIIHSVHRPPQRELVKVAQTESGKWREVTEQQGTKELTPSVPANQDGSAPVTPTDDRGRTRRKKRDFFGTIKKRLSRSKNRSKSMDPGDLDEAMARDNSLSRSISADRARDPSASSAGYLLVPGLRDGEGSTRSSISEMSGISGASTRTYINEASTLVLETVENGVKKHYLVPITMAQKSKWRKKGTKLHIFNDHTFIAKHLSGGTICHVCNKAVGRRIGKQGYECRDCQIRCHKHCHVKVDTNCTCSTIQNIELLHIQSPYVDKRVYQLKTMS